MAEGKVAVPEKIGSEKPASIAAGILPAALLVGQKPEPASIHRHTPTKVRR
jgi:hypothetical protein